MIMNERRKSTGDNIIYYIELVEMIVTCSTLALRFHNAFIRFLINDGLAADSLIQTFGRNCLIRKVV
jgi:hypothetical protein